MKKTNASEDQMSSRVIDEIAFQAGILALHAAIASAATDLKSPPEELGAAPYFDEARNSLTERARRPSEGTEPLNRPAPRGR